MRNIGVESTKQVNAFRQSSSNISPFTFKDWVGPASVLSSCQASLDWFVSRILWAGAWLDLKELFHLEKTLGIFLILHRLRDCTLVHKSIGHSTCTSVSLGRMEHLLSEILIGPPDVSGLRTVLIPLYLSVKVSQHGLDRGSGSQWRSVRETHILVWWNDCRRGQLFKSLSASAPIPETAKIVLAFHNRSFFIDSFSKLSRMSDSQVGILTVEVLLLYETRKVGWLWVEFWWAFTRYLRERL